MDIMNWLRKLPGYQRTPAGFEWRLLRLMPSVWLAGTVLPALPGTLLVLAGIVMGAWIDDFSRVGWLTLSVVVVLALLAWAFSRWVPGAMPYPQHWL